MMISIQMEMISMTKGSEIPEEVLRMDELCPGFKDNWLSFEQMELPTYPSCGSEDTAIV